MDPEERDLIFTDAISGFFQDQADALWLYENVRQRVKADFPDLELPSTQRPPGNGLATRVTNTNSRVEGNIWKIIRVSIPSSDLFADYLRRQSRKKWKARQQPLIDYSTRRSRKASQSTGYRRRSISYASSEQLNLPSIVSTFCNVVVPSHTQNCSATKRIKPMKLRSNNGF